MPDSIPNGTDKPKRGRPKKAVDLELVEKLAHIQCTYNEIASTLGCSVDTLQRHKDFAATYKRGAEGGRKSLRRMQFESANKGNIAMQIWLGKQYLAQSDHSTEIRLTPENMPPKELALLIHSLPSAQVKELLEEAVRLTGVSPHDYPEQNIVALVASPENDAEFSRT